MNETTEDRHHDRHPFVRRSARQCACWKARSASRLKCARPSPPPRHSPVPKIAVNARVWTLVHAPLAFARNRATRMSGMTTCLDLTPHATARASENRCTLKLMPILRCPPAPDRQAADQVRWGNTGFDRRRFFMTTSASRRLADDSFAPEATNGPVPFPRCLR